MCSATTTSARRTTASAGVSTLDWLLTPQQRLLEVTAGPVFADDGRLAPVRAELAWYPDDVWFWILAAQWRRIAQEESFAGRAAERADELGFLLERRYAPYSKWFGTAFAALDAAAGGRPAARSGARRDRRARARGRARPGLRGGCPPPGRPDARAGAAGVPVLQPAVPSDRRRFAEACLERVAGPRLRALPLVAASSPCSTRASERGRERPAPRTGPTRSRRVPLVPLVSLRSPP